jgi:hypothetical protein
MERYDMDQEARRIAEAMAEECVRWSRGDQAIGLPLAYAVISQFLTLVRAELQPDRSEPVRTGKS